jgi:hypothetical protein
MKTRTAAILLSMLLAGCGQVERIDVSTVTENMVAHTQNLVRLEGTRVKRSRYVRAVSVGTHDYFVLEDESGRIRVWYDTVRRRCPPRLGAQVIVEGKVVETGHEKRLLFLARSISIEHEAPLADNEVRLCQLSRAESEIYWRGGREELLAYWRGHGKPDRALVVD